MQGILQVRARLSADKSLRESPLEREGSFSDQWEQEAIRELTGNEHGIEIP